MKKAHSYVLSRDQGMFAAASISVGVGMVLWAGIARTVAARSIRQRASSLQTTAAVNPQIGRYRLLVKCADPCDAVPLVRAACAPARVAHARPPKINLAEHRIRRKQVLGGLTHEYQIAA